MTDAVVAAVPDRDFIIRGSRRLTYAEVAERSQRLAAFLHAQGLGCHTERASLASHQVGQSLLGICLYNGNVFVEALLASFRGRVAPFNVNYRYTGNELLNLLSDGPAAGLIYQAQFAPKVAEIRQQLPALHLLIQVADDSGNALLDGAFDYETIVAITPTHDSLPLTSPDDLYVLYTGGTTGTPKGVLWRQHDIFMSALGGRHHDGDDDAASSCSDIAQAAMMCATERRLILPPLMHGAAQWAVMAAMAAGHTAVFTDTNDHLNPDVVLETIERQRVSMLALVGDSMAKPLLDAIERSSVDLSSLAVVASGGASLSQHVRRRLFDAVPGVAIVDSVGSSEAGAQMHAVYTATSNDRTLYVASCDTELIADDFSGMLTHSSDEVGWLAQRGFIPLGYNNDPERTASTFRTVEGVRYAVAGDRARWHKDGTIELLGRDAATVNSGGEKIFVEEVESAIGSHDSVLDVLVTGRPSERWGQEVVAIVAVRDGLEVTSEQLIDHASTLLARYKLPKEVIFRPIIQRSPAGKPDYHWARLQLLSP